MHKATAGVSKYHISPQCLRKKCIYLLSNCVALPAFGTGVTHSYFGP